MNFITLTGYYPAEYPIVIEVNSIVAFLRNVTNENSKGSTVHVSGATMPFQVLETTGEIMEIMTQPQPAEDKMQ